MNFITRLKARRLAKRIIDDHPDCADLSKEDRKLLANALIAEPEAAAPLKITQGAVLRSRARDRTGIEARASLAKRIFRAAEPPPGVLPDGAKMALDDANPGSALTLNVIGWASQLGYNSAFQEGTVFLGYAYLSELAQRAEYRVMSEVIGSEMTREWIDLKSSGDEGNDDKLKEITAEFKRLKVQQAFAKAAIHDGFFGRGHIYLDTGDTDDRPELQMSIGNGRDETSKAKVSKEKPLLALRNVEPVWTYPTTYDSNDPLKPDWYKPTQWFVMGKQIHASRLLTFIGREVPDLLKPAYSFGGLSMSQMAKPYVDNWLRTRQSVADIISAFSVMVLHTDLATTLQNGGEQLFMRLELFNNLRNNRSVMAVDKNTEEFGNVSAPLGGLDTLQAQTQEHMAAVSRIPLVKLLGIQPAGLNASSEGEIRAFYDWIAAFQELLFRENLQRVLDFIQLSLYGEIDAAITFEFVDLWQLDAVAAAALEKTKTDIDDANIAMGAIDAVIVQERLVGDPKSIYKGIDLSGVKKRQQAEAELNAYNPAEEGDPGEGEEGGEHEQGEEEPGQQGAQPTKARDPSDRLASSVSNRSASFGSPATNGFKGDSAFNEGDHPRRTDGKFGTGGASQAPISGLTDALEDKHPGLKLDMSDNGNTAILSRIVVPKAERGSGTGSEVMKAVTEWADKAGRSIALSPSSDLGGNKNRLVDFYKRFGFVENKGRNKDYSISESMIRPAKHQAHDAGFEEHDHPRGEGGKFAPATQIPFESSPKVGWWEDGEHMNLYHGTHERNVPTIAKEGLTHKDPTSGMISMALEPHTAHAYASMSGIGGEHNFRKTSNVTNTPHEQRAVMKYKVPRSWIKENIDPDLRGNLNEMRDRMRDKGAYEKWAKEYGPDFDHGYYARGELRFKNAIPPEFLEGVMKKPVKARQTQARDAA
jgi:phage-related protein (TIGR01555 family)